MDIDILVAIQNMRGALGDAFFGAVTLLGGEIPLMALVCCVYWCVSKPLGTRLTLTFFVSLLANQFLKLAFRVERPWVRDARVKPVQSALDAATGYSFPSGHTANAVASYGALSLSVRSKPAKWALWALVALIGFSRMYLGVHTIQDVLVSLAMGIIITYALRALCAYIDAHPRADAYVALSGIILSLALTAFACASDTSLSLDAFKFAGGALGVMLGWLLERRLLKFDTQTSLIKKAARLMLGMALIIAVLEGLKPPLNAVLGARAGGFARYALVGITAIYLWPWAFTKLKL